MSPKLRAAELLASRVIWPTKFDALQHGLGTGECDGEVVVVRCINRHADIATVARRVPLHLVTFQADHRHHPTVLVAVDDILWNVDWWECGPENLRVKGRDHRAVHVEVVCCSARVLVEGTGRVTCASLGTGLRAEVDACCAGENNSSSVKWKASPCTAAGGGVPFMFAAEDGGRGLGGGGGDGDGGCESQWNGGFGGTNSPPPQVVRALPRHTLQHWICLPDGVLNTPLHPSATQTVPFVLQPKLWPSTQRVLEICRLTAQAPEAGAPTARAACNATARMGCIWRAECRSGRSPLRARPASIYPPAADR